MESITSSIITPVPQVPVSCDATDPAGEKFTNSTVCKSDTQAIASAHGGVTKQRKGAQHSSRWTTIGGLSALSLVLVAADLAFFGRGSKDGGLLGLLLGYGDGASLTMELALIISLAGTAIVAGRPAWLRFNAPTRRNASESKAGSHLSSGSTARRGVPAPKKAANSTRVVSRHAAALAQCNQSIDTAAREGDTQKAGQMLLEFERVSGQPDVMSYNLVLRACAKAVDVDAAERWMKRMESRGVRPTLCSYNTLMDACAKANKPEACEAWLQRMLDAGLEANVISYATAIYARARRGDVEAAEAWLKRTVAAGVEPDAVSYNSVIHAYSVKGNAAGAEHWLGEMRKKGLQTSVASFTAVIDACAKSGDVPRAEHWLEQMLQDGLEPTVVTFGAMIDACAKAGNLARAEFWHEKMGENGIEPNAHSYSAVINACAKAGGTGGAEAAEQWLDRSEKAGIVSDVVIYSGVIDACGKAGDAERALRVFQRMRANGLKPHIVAYAALARPFAYRGDWVKVESIRQNMAADGVVMNEYFLYAQLLAYAVARPRQHDRAEQCFRDALSAGMEPNDHVVGALARAVGRGRCIELMNELCNGREVPAQPQRRAGGGSGGRSGTTARSGASGGRTGHETAYQ